MAGAGGPVEARKALTPASEVEMPRSLTAFDFAMPFVHEKTVVISESQLDSFGHLNNARYLELFEQARWDLITERGYGLETIRRTKAGPTILEVNLRFLRELTPRETILIRSELVSYERKIGKMRQQMLMSDGSVACEALFTFALFDIERRKLVEPSPAWARAVGQDEK
jgi:acyl-CoA thioester hydrolase